MVKEKGRKCYVVVVMLRFFLKYHIDVDVKEENGSEWRFIRVYGGGPCRVQGEDLGDDEVVDIVPAKAIADGRGFQQDFVFP